MSAVKTCLLMFVIVLFSTCCASQQVIKRTHKELSGLKETYYVLKSDNVTRHGEYSLTWGKIPFQKGFYKNGEKSGFWAYYLHDDVEFIYDFDTKSIVTDSVGQSRHALYSEGFNYFSYLVDQYLEYPEEAKAQHIEGDVIIEFMIMPDGTVTDFALHKGCGNWSLNNEAYRVITKVALENPWYPAVDQYGRKAGYINYSTIGFHLKLNIRVNIY